MDADKQPSWDEPFLETLGETGSVSRACRVAGIARPVAYARRDTDRRFARAWDTAVSRAIDALEDAAIQRALEGTEKIVFYQGKAVGTVREFSDSLLMFLLKARKPQRYRDRAPTEPEPPVAVELIDFDPPESRDKR